MKTVVILHYDEDGDIPEYEEMSAEKFLARLAEGYYGTEPVFAEPGQNVGRGQFCGLLVIEGRVVKPKPVQHVTAYAL